VPLGRLCLSFNKLQRILLANTVDGACLVAESHTVTLVSNVHNLRAESGANELCADLVGDGVEESRDCCTVLGIEVRVNLVKDDHRAALGCLQGKDETERAKTFRKLANITK